MLSAMNLAGFGVVAWDDESTSPDVPWTYRTPGLPFFDRNLRALSRKARATALLGHVRGVMLNDREIVNAQNVHPFSYEGTPISLAMNGDLDRFAEMRGDVAALVSPEISKHVEGTTDSEWIYALLLTNLEDPFAEVADPEELAAAVEKTLRQVREIRKKRGFQRQSAVNLVISDGRSVVATRFAFDYGWYHEGWSFAGGERRFDYTTLWYAAGTGYGCHDGRVGDRAGRPADVRDRGLRAPHAGQFRVARGARVLPARGDPRRRVAERRAQGARCLRRPAPHSPSSTCSRDPTPRSSTGWRRLRTPSASRPARSCFTKASPGIACSCSPPGASRPRCACRAAASWRSCPWCRASWSARWVCSPGGRAGSRSTPRSRPSVGAGRPPSSAGWPDPASSHSSPGSAESRSSACATSTSASATSAVPIRASPRRPGTRSSTPPSLFGRWTRSPTRPPTSRPSSSSAHSASPSSTSCSAASGAWRPTVARR